MTDYIDADVVVLVESVGSLCDSISELIADIDRLIDINKTIVDALIDQSKDFDDGR